MDVSHVEGAAAAAAEEDEEGAHAAEADDDEGADLTLQCWCKIVWEKGVSGVECSGCGVWYHDASRWHGEGAAAKAHALGPNEPWYCARACKAKKHFDQEANVGECGGRGIKNERIKHRIQTHTSFLGRPLTYFPFLAAFVVPFPQSCSYIVTTWYRSCPEAPRGKATGDRAIHPRKTTSLCAFASTSIRAAKSSTI